MLSLSQDFGLARQLDSAEALWSRDWAGTPGFMAPEIDRAMKTTAEKREPHGLNADVWSMGVLIEKIAAILGSSSVAAELVSFACVEDRAARPTAEQLREKLRSMSTDAQSAVDAAVDAAVDSEKTQNAKPDDAADEEYETDFEPVVGQPRSVAQVLDHVADEEYEDDFEPLSLVDRSAARKSASVLVDGGFLEGRASEYRSLYDFSNC